MHGREGLVMTLVCLLLLQALIPIQSHTRWIKTPEGRFVEMCTLQGLVLVDTGAGEQIDEEDQTRSPAMAFSNLLCSAVGTVADAAPAWVALVSTESPIYVPLAVPALFPVQQRPIRAPPFSPDFSRNVIVLFRQTRRAFAYLTYLPAA